MTAVPRVPRSYRGPALFSYGFRPFFLAGSAWAAISLAIWIPQFFGELTLPTAFAPRDWHVHEMLYGYLVAIVAGFLLTAIPNWTGRLPVAGLPLAALVALWFAGRIAILVSALTSAGLVALIDVSFLVALAGVALREIIAGRNWRNLRVMAILIVLIAGNIVFHLEAAISGTAEYGTRIGIASAIALIMLVGGRIIPSFTHNYLQRQTRIDGKTARLPRSFSRLDAFSIATGVIALTTWIVLPSGNVTGGLLILAGLVHMARLARWAGDRTFFDRLVLALHIGYSFVPIGFLLIGLALIRPESVSVSAGLHAWTGGAVGMMTLAVMTRVTLGHTGRFLSASRATEAVYGLVVIAAIARIGATIGHAELLLHIAAFAWVAAFGGFVLSYGPMLLQVSRTPANRC